MKQTKNNHQLVVQWFTVHCTTNWWLFFVCFIELQPAVNPDILDEFSWSWAQNDQGDNPYSTLDDKYEKKCVGNFWVVVITIYVRDLYGSCNILDLILQARMQKNVDWPNSHATCSCHRQCDVLITVVQRTHNHVMNHACTSFVPAFRLISSGVSLRAFSHP